MVALALLEQTDRWYRTAGGGDGALLARRLLAAMSTAGDPDDRRRPAGHGPEASAAECHEVAAAAADALARQAAERGDTDEAAGCWRRPTPCTSIRHVVDDEDRTDAQLAPHRRWPSGRGCPYSDP